MNKLTLDLQYCYGIKRLKAEFDFTQCGAYAIYAPNGMMKSSFAQTFKDIAAGEASQDRVFPGRTTKRKVKDETGKDLAEDAVLVLPPYDEVFGDSEKTATLLVDAKLRKEYEQLYSDVERAKTAFLKAMKTQSKSKRDLIGEISLTFTKSDSEFYQALIRVQDEVEKLPQPQFANVPYDLVADEKIATFLSAPEIKAVLQDYINQYNDLLAKSKYFRKGTFDYYNAETIAKALTKNGFFRAKHSVTLNSDSKVELTTEKQLADVIAKEKAAILHDAELKKKFNDMEKKINRNEMLRDFQEFLADNEGILVLMGNLEKLKEELWKSYFKEHEHLYNDLISKYKEAEVRGKQIEAAAAAQRTLWEGVIEIFNQRFFVPFKLQASNKVSVVLGGAVAPTLAFTFQDGTDTAEIDREALLQVLSTGEKKALYILNVIFEVEVRRQTHAATVFVVDDIADSFDYKNKYSIIQYLRDISEEACFRQLILTHNFDFFRTVNSRFVKYSHCLMVQRVAEGLTLVPATGIKNIFVNDWKREFFRNARKRVAAISFVRNIVEYTKGDEDTDYATLTSLLHWRGDSATISQAELDKIYKNTFSDPGESWAHPTASVIDAIRAEAAACLSAPEGVNFENKIVLAIGIRLEAERYMVTQIADPSFVQGIAANQTAKLLAKYKSLRGAAHETVRVLDEVTLMTPENIHLNSFMYEPIIDMSDDHLRRLYGQVLSLS